MPQTLGIIASHVNKSLYEDGTLLGIGINNRGQLGVENIEFTSNVIQIGEPVWTQISVGYRQVLAIDENQDLWGWGDSSWHGMLGLGPITTPVSIPTKITIPDKKWSFVYVGVLGSFAIDTDGDLYTTGSGQYSINGDTTNLNRFRRFPHLQDKKWVKAAIGGGTVANYDRRYAFAIDADGVMWSWGHNWYGAIGLGKNISTTSSNITQLPESGTDSIRANKRWKDVSCGYAHTAAIDEDGYLYMCGITNAFPANATKPPTNSPLFIQIHNEPEWESVYCVKNGRYSTEQFYVTYAIKKDGTLWSFGQNDSSGRAPIGNGLRNSLFYDFTQIGVDRKWKKCISDTGVRTNNVLFIDENDIPFGMGNNGQYNIVSLLTNTSPIVTLTPFNNKFKVKDVACTATRNSYFVVKNI